MVVAAYAIQKSGVLVGSINIKKKGMKKKYDVKASVMYSFGSQISASWSRLHSVL